MNSSLRAKRSNPACDHGDALDCFVRFAPRNDRLPLLLRYCGRAADGGWRARRTRRELPRRRVRLTGRGWRGIAETEEIAERIALWRPLRQRLLRLRRRERSVGNARCARRCRMRGTLAWRGIGDGHIALRRFASDFAARPGKIVGAAGGRAE